MISFSPRIAIVDGKSGLFSQFQEFTGGLFNYNPVRYRVKEVKDGVTYLKEKRTEAHTWFKVAALATIILPLYAVAKVAIRWIWSASYQVTGKRPEGVAPSLFSATNFLMDSSIEPGSSVEYMERGVRKTLTLSPGRFKMNDDEIENQNAHQVYLDGSSSITLYSETSYKGIVRYMASGEKIGGKGWKEYLSYQAAIDILFLEHPDPKFYLEALKNGKVVYVSIEEEDENTNSKIIFHDSAPIDGRSYEPRHRDGSCFDYKTFPHKNWPVYEVGGQTVITNYQLARDLLTNQNEDDIGKFVVWAALNPKSGEYELSYFWNEVNKEKERLYVSSNHPPESNDDYKFGEEEIKRAFLGKGVFYR